MNCNRASSRHQGRDRNSVGAALPWAPTTRRQLLGGALLLPALALPAPGRGALADPVSRYATAWAAGLDLLPFSIADRTLRLAIRATIGGSEIRVRLSNAFGEAPLRIGSAHIGHRRVGAEVVAGSNTPLHFAGRSGATLPPGADLLTDPAAFSCAAGEDLLLSIHVASAHEALTGHLRPKDTSYLSPTGDHGAWHDGSPFTTEVAHWFVASALLVSPAKTSSIVFIGDSITDSGGVPRGSYQGWTDIVARRIAGLPAPRQFGVANVAISGNRLLSERPGGGPNILSRLDRDAFSQAGADTLFILAGINDIYGADQSAADLIAALDQVSTRARLRGLSPVAGTLLPAHRQGYTAAREATRAAVNTWLRSSRSYDAVVDFDAALRDPASPDRLQRAYDSGDGLHPSAAGNARMAEAFLATDLAGELPRALSVG